MDQPSDPNREDLESEFYLEITPLSLSEPTSWSRFWTRPRQLLLAGGAVLLILALVLTHLPAPPSARIRASSRPTIVSQVSITLLPTSTPLGVLGAVPAGCPPGNAVNVFSSAYPPAVGIDTLALWVVGFSGGNATLHLNGFPETPLGWQHKLLLVAAPTLTQSITLQVEPVFPGEGVALLSPSNADLAMDALTFTPHTAAASSVTGWRSWPLNIFIQSAGCYYLGFQYGGREASGTYFAAGQ